MCNCRKNRVNEQPVVTPEPTPQAIVIQEDWYNNIDEIKPIEDGKEETM